MVLKYLQAVATYSKLDSVEIGSNASILQLPAIAQSVREGRICRGARWRTEWLEIGFCLPSVLRGMSLRPFAGRSFCSFCRFSDWALPA